ncbi:hypothetical protein DMB65_02160 [Flavobacterium cheongpyeongense]|uniref:Cytochrome C551 n=1 Tax=Flavobacterium cheongpyeongense TaxID=2212651 RepID=A0A2V4BYA1_9FLAO|nr:hypothetical protein [Flavobacterium cheongpyeongense]PXY42843.1 hypothetical protein DMB65_02160 [Flavobacterium cheongpyeongense]
MKTKLNYILFALVIVLNFSCTNDDDQEVTTTSKTKTSIMVNNVEEKSVLNNSVSTLKTPDDGEPSNPKTK